MRLRHHVAIVFFTILTLCVVFSAQADNRCGDYNYKLNKNGKAVITKYNGNDSEVVIPNSLDGNEVVEIGKRAFYSSDIEKITIPESVSTIGSYAFGFSEDLLEVSTYATLIKDHAFTYCSDLETVTLFAKQTAIEEQAFYSCESLETIKGTLYNPGSYSVAFCDSLTSVTIAGSFVDDHAFTYCSSLKSVSFLGEATTINEQAFYTCDQLTTITGTVSNVGSYAFAFDSKLAEITISGNNISDHAFTYCEKLKSVTLLTPYVDIEEQGFYNCGKLETVTGLVGNVGSYAFGFCEKLQALDVTGTEIEDDAFTYCSKLLVRVPNESETIAAIKVAKVHYTTADNLSVRPETKNESDSPEPITSSSNMTVVSEVATNEWQCDNCGNLASGNFCNNCGAKKSATEEVTPSAVTAEPTSAPTDAPVVESTTRHASELTLESAVRYMLSPEDNTITVSIIDMGEGTFSVLSSKGKSYLGLVEREDDTYGIQLMSTASGDSYSTEDSPYDYNSQGFINVLNYLLKDHGKTIVSIIPMYDTMFSALDTTGKSYVVQVMYSEAMIMIGLFGT